MSLFLYEFVPAHRDRASVEQLLREVEKAVSEAGAELIEAQVTGEHDRVFAVLDAATTQRAHVDPARFATAAEVVGPDPVRLVGADLEQLRAARPSAGYLVEWDLPAELTMDTYLERKKAKAPRYADVPEVSFLRTYVREDMAKCLCFYDAEDEQTVRRGRAAVDTPIDRLHSLDPGAVTR